MHERNRRCSPTESTLQAAVSDSSSIRRSGRKDARLTDALPAICRGNNQLCSNMLKTLQSLGVGKDSEAGWGVAAERSFQTQTAALLLLLFLFLPLCVQVSFTETSLTLTCYAQTANGQPHHLLCHGCHGNESPAPPVSSCDVVM